MTKRILFSILLLMLTIPVFSQTGFKLNLLNVEKIKLVSHDRLQFSVGTGDLPWPPIPANQVIGWRVYFSRYAIGWAEPQYEYAAWSVPTSSEYLTRSFWIVNPSKLEGFWHIRVDAIWQDRTIYATTDDCLYDFGTDTVTPALSNVAFLPWVVNVDGWQTLLSMTNATSLETTVKCTYRNPQGVLVGSPKTFVLKPYSNEAFAIQYFVPSDVTSIAGSLMVESSHPVSILSILQYQGVQFSVAHELTK